MKTVQEWLLKLDEEELTGCFLAANPMDFEMLENKERTIGDVLVAERAQIKDFINRLRMADATQLEQDVFYAVKMLKNGHEEVGVELSRLEEILNNDIPKHYGWMNLDHDKVMGCLVADTELTRDNIYSVIAGILVELSLLGFSREKQEENRKRIEAILRRDDEKIKSQSYKGTGYSLDEFREHFAEIFGYKPEKRDEQAEKLRREVQMAEYRFNEYCRKREVLQVRELIQMERGKAYIDDK